MGCKPEPLTGTGDGIEDQSQESEAERYESSPIVAYVGDQPIRVYDIDYLHASLHETAHAAFSSAATRPRLLEYLLRAYLMAELAERDGVIGSPEEMMLLLETDARLAVDEIGQEYITTPTEAEMREVFDTSPLFSSVPERRRGLVAIFETRQEAVDFAELVEARSGDYPFDFAFQFHGLRLGAFPTPELRADRGGLGFVVHPDDGGDVNLELADALYALEEENTLTAPFRTERGWEIALLVEIVPPVVLSFERERGTLYEMVIAQHRAAGIRQWLDDRRSAVTPVAEVVSELEELRGEEADDAGSLPRRFSERALAGDPTRILTHEEYSEFATQQEWTNELANPGRVAQVESVPEGSGQSSDRAPEGSGVGLPSAEGAEPLEP